MHRCSTPALLFTTLLVACGGPPSQSFVGGGGTLTGGDSQGDADTDTDTDTDTGVDPELGPLQSACMEGEDGSAAELESIRLSSTITWALDFDAAAEAIGMVDCSYTRTYAGLQRFGWSHLCPECDFIVRGDATMVAGLECYEQIAAEARSVRTELWAIEDGTKLHRSGRDQFPMPTVLAELEGASGDGAPVPVSWASEGNALSDGGSFSLAAEGTVGWSLDPEALQMDPMGPRAAPYACGWECEDPGDLSGVAPITEGEVIPNGRFRDQCGEPVDLWDFHGSYLVIEASQNDCGPCRSMADAHAAFVQEMRAAGIPVRVITLMGNGLSASWETPDAETVADWVQTYGLTEPVLADEAWALSYFPSFIEEYSGESYGYPAWIVVDPALRAIHGNVGFSSWDAVAAVIQADARGQRARHRQARTPVEQAPALPRASAR